jgi:hypothetical protein
MSTKQTIASLKKKNRMLEASRDWFAKEQDFWRAKFLKEHPEKNNWEYVESAQSKEAAALFA